MILYSLNDSVWFLSFNVYKFWWKMVQNWKREGGALK